MAIVRWRVRPPRAFRTDGQRRRIRRRCRLFLRLLFLLAPAPVLVLAVLILRRLVCRTLTVVRLVGEVRLFLRRRLSLRLRV